jgi:hypothetical protein
LERDNHMEGPREFVTATNKRIKRPQAPSTLLHQLRKPDDPGLMLIKIANVVSTKVVDRELRIEILVYLFLPAK